MASPSSGRYQSRLFNFVHQQSRRLTENLRSASRHLQVSASWGAQLLLYPVYLLFQSKRSAGKQFYQNVQQSWPQLQADNTISQPQTPPTADTPIQRVLLLVNVPSEEAVSTPKQGKTEPINFLAFLSKQWFKFFSNSPKSTSSLTPLHSKSTPAQQEHPCSPTSYSALADSPTRNRPVVRGIATQLSSHTLVLVTAQNEILDILTPQQQQKLQERIIGEMADYWRYQRLAHSAELGQAYPTLRETGSPLEYSLHTYQALAFLDRTFAQLETNYLAPVSEVAITISQRSRDLVQRVQTQLTVLLSGLPQPTGSKSSPSNNSEAHTLQIQALIWAAIDYFFGHRRRKQLGQTTPTTISLELQPGSKPNRKPLPQRHSGRQSGGGTIRPPSASSNLPSAQLPSQLVSDPWLTLGDLFGDSESGVREPSTVHEPELSNSQTMSHLAGKTNSALPSSQSAGYSVQNLLSRFQRLFPQPEQAPGLVKRQKTTKGKAVAVGKEIEKVGSKQLSLLPKPSQSVSAGESSNQPCTQSTQLDPAPDWIETNARLMGYVKHPLEKLLQWLDQAMLWLEDVLMIVWQWVQKLLQGK